MYDSHVTLLTCVSLQAGAFCAIFVGFRYYFACFEQFVKISIWAVVWLQVKNSEIADKQKARHGAYGHSRETHHGTISPKHTIKI